MKERIQKLMAQAGVGSRRHNEALIVAERVRLNGRLARLGDKADPTVDQITVDGARLNLRTEKFVYIALHKPRGVLSSLEDEMGEDRTTVRDLIDLPGHLYPVGRLDKPSEGLMLMTNDGDLAHQLTHPRYGHEKTYRVAVDGQPSRETLDQWRAGVMLDGRPTIPAKIEVIRQEKAFTTLKIVMREGRKRQIRRIAAQLGHPTRHLLREAIGPLKLGALSPGKWRFLTPEEVAELKGTTRPGGPSKGAKAKPGRKPVSGRPASKRPTGKRPTGGRPASGPPTGKLRPGKPKPGAKRSRD
jgi:23S rRNA pseudouridine2605 synthase